MRNASVLTGCSENRDTLVSLPSALKYAPGKNFSVSGAFLPSLITLIALQCTEAKAPDSWSVLPGVSAGPQKKGSLCPMKQPDLEQHEVKIPSSPTLSLKLTPSREAEEVRHDTSS